MNASKKEESSQKLQSAKVKKMIKRLVGKELIEQSLMELLQLKTIEEITVTEIAKNCGISSRAFYNHFKDKHEVVSSIYIRHMKQYLNCTLEEWYEQLGNFMEKNSLFMEHTLCYNGQNNLGETILQVDWQKLEKHIKPEVRADRIELTRTQIAIEYMLYGNIGTTRNSYVQKNQSAMGKYMFENYGGTWGYLSANIPPLILQNLSMEPIKPE